MPKFFKSTLIVIIISHIFLIQPCYALGLNGAFSHSGDFLTQRSFTISVAAELARRLSPACLPARQGRAQTSSPHRKIALQFFGVPEIAQAPLLKIAFVRKRSLHFLFDRKSSQKEIQSGSTLSLHGIRELRVRPDFVGAKPRQKAWRVFEPDFAYDGFDRLETTTYHDGSFKHFTYDKNSNLKTKNTNDDPETQITYDYDVLNRLDFKTYPDLSIVDYAYDLGSRLTSVENPAVSISYQYDNVNRVIQTDSLYSLLACPDRSVGAALYSVSYHYDQVGNRTQLTYPSATVLNYTYDELNRLKKIYQASPTEPIAKYNYDSLSRRKRLDLENNTFTQYSYDNLNRLLSLSNKAAAIATIPGGSPPGSGGSGSGSAQGPGIPITNLPTPPASSPVNPTETVLSKFAYTYDNAGNRETMTTLGSKTHTYTYDDIYQLEDVTYPSGSTPQNVHYDFDSVGNRDLVTTDSVPTDYVPNNLNQYSSVGGQSYTYDQNGNLLNDGLNSYTYDYENRLISATNQQTIQLTTYSYDGFGRRISKTVDGITTYFIYDGDQVIEERDSSGQLTASYIYGAVIDEVLRMTRNNDYYYHYDGLGSVTDITDSNNTLVESYSYDVYGKPTIKDGTGKTIPTSTIGNRFMFTGREYDSEIGSYYWRARQNSFDLGRFFQRDPKEILDVNLYRYCFNDPINLFDPFGLDTYFINNKFNSSEPTNSFISHSFVAITKINPDTGKEEVIETYGWVNTNGGMWEDIYKGQNKSGAQKAIDAGIGAWKEGEQDLDKYIEAEFEKRKDEKGGFWPGPKGTCKDQARSLINDAIKQKALDEVQK